MKKTFKGFAVGNILRNKKLYAIVALIVVLICTLIFSLSFVTPKIANAIDTDARSTLVGKWSADSSPNNTPKNYTDFDSAWRTATTGTGKSSYIKLEGDIEIPATSTTRTLNGNYVKLDLNGHVITYTASTGSVFAIVDKNNNGGLYITDSNPNAVNTIKNYGKPGEGDRELRKYPACKAHGRQRPGCGGGRAQHGRECGAGGKAGGRRRV